MNIHRAYPTALGQEGTGGLPQFKKSDDPSDLGAFTEEKGAKLTQKLLALMWVGYPNDATGAIKNGDLTKEQLRNATQNAIWHLTDGYNAAPQLSGDTLKAYNVMIGQSQSQTLSFGTKFELKPAPAGSKLNVYVPTNNVNPPAGYKQWQNLLSSQFFDKNDKPISPEPNNPNEPGDGEFKVNFEKLDKDTKTFVAGAKLQLRPQFNSSTINGKAGDFTWDSKGAAEEIKMSPGEYLLKELQAPQNYKPIKKPSLPIARVDVADDGSVTVKTEGDSVVFEDGTVKIFNEAEAPKSFDVVISKTDVAGKEIAGAQIEVWSAGAGGKKLESWTSAAGESKKIKLAAGDYVFKETVAPKGFKVVSEIAFKVGADGKVTTTDVQQTVDGKKVATADGGKLTVINEAEAPKSFDVVISKTDVAGKEIAGAQIEVWSAGAGGKKLESWTSAAGESKKIKLAAGDYVFKETVAPKGFKVVSEIAFKVGADGKVTTTDVQQTVDGKKVATADGGKLTVINEAQKTDVNPDTSSTSGSSAPSKPQDSKKPLATTGAQVGMLTLLAGALMAGGVVLVSRRKRS
ncbi:SpaA isopeptide-forming pilin-related protein [Arcanobacterium haemolyticum]|uniref:SpaA isopeptide-forming pilin-related protein n=1 Tax=Arcanobacterium haemolyticum TaxID=28264 RepID=UPI0015ECD343|nr:SpaA isopeptide-forming pilin-related protein [Arcanobacterium haemolyticum]